MNNYRVILVTIALSSIVSLSHAELISITDPSYQVPNSSQGILRPTQGMSMALVEQKFGQPEQKSDAIGHPPITRWIYNNFVVFFEDNLVIHSVVPHQQ